MHDDRRRGTPRTDQILADLRLRSASEQLGPRLVKAAVHHAQQRCREGDIEPGAVLDAAVAALPRAATSLQPVINATGVIVHTNLGRAPLSEAARRAVDIAAGAVDVELDLATGRRGTRGGAAIEALATRIPAAEAVHVVNNGAAALALVACGLATGREVVVARGEMVEIGDGFRIPELVESVGARLREVGTTNRVRYDDYAAAIRPDTAFVLKVHPSNFVVSGFTSTVEVSVLATLDVPVVADIGSGLLVPHPRLPDEPSADKTLAAGAALVTASGDKLLGGPQCGLVVGRRDLVDRLRRHPLARALRVDKLTLAALEATLTGPTPPVPRALDAPVDDLLVRAKQLADALAGRTDVTVVETEAVVGGGGAPGVTLPSAGISLPAELATRLRTGQPSIVGRVERGRLVLDLMMVEPAADEIVAARLRTALDETNRSTGAEAL